MSLAYLQPIEEQEVLQNFAYEKIGGRIAKHTQKSGLPSTEGVQIAVFTLVDASSLVPHTFRKYFYNLFMGNWNISIADFGNLPIGNTQEDTFFVIKEIIREFLSAGITPIVIADKQEVTYGIYRAFDTLEQLVNLVCVDAVFDFGNENEFVCPNSYMSRILMEEPTNLNHYTNIGYQTYYNAQETLDVLDKMYFDSYRLGQVTQYLEMIEPILRNTDIVSVDMRSVQACDLDDTQGFPSGFSNREICSIARYAGLSMQTSVFGLFEIPNTARALQLTAQILWYFIEGYNYRIQEFPTPSDPNFTKYNVLVDELIIEFYKSNLTGRWWILPSEYSVGNSMLPCTEKDYEQACSGIIPKRWWNLYKKTLL